MFYAFGQRLLLLITLLIGFSNIALAETIPCTMASVTTVSAHKTHCDMQATTMKIAECLPTGILVTDAKTPVFTLPTPVFWETEKPLVTAQFTLPATAPPLLPSILLTTARFRI